jgi:hypothetical protein
MSQLIQYADGVIIQIAQRDPTQPVSFTGVGNRIAKQFDAAIQILDPLLKPINEVIGRTLRNSSISEGKIKLGLSFSAEGDVYVAKMTGEANLEITLTYKQT